MKILLVNKYWYRRGGAEVVCLHTADLLRKAGHEVVAFSMKHPKNEPSPQEKFFVEHVDFPTLRGPLRLARQAFRSIYSRNAYRRIARLLEQERPDVAHLHNVYFHLTPSILYALRNARVPVVHTLHDYHLECPNHAFYDYRRGVICEDCLRFGFRRVVTNGCMQIGRAPSVIAFLEAWLYRRLGTYHRLVDRYIAPSEFLRSKLTRRAAPPDRVSVLPNTVDDYGDLGPPSQDAVFFYAGRLAWEKGLDLILEVASRLPETRWRLAGNGPMEEALHAGIQRRGLSNIELIGAIDPAGLREEYRRATAVVLPSLCYENCPLTVLEAMSAGRPTIGSRIGGIAELVHEVKTGWLFETGSAADFERAVRQSLESPNATVHIGRAARDRFEKRYTPAMYLPHLLAIYENVLAEKREKSRANRDGHQEFGGRHT